MLAMQYYILVLGEVGEMVNSSIFFSGSAGPIFYQLPSKFVVATNHKTKEYVFYSGLGFIVVELKEHHLNQLVASMNIKESQKSKSHVLDIL